MRAPRLRSLFAALVSTVMKPLGGRTTRMKRLISFSLFAVLVLASVRAADAIHIPNHPAGSIIELDTNAPGFITPLPSGAVVFHPFFDGVFNLGSLYHWDTEIWNLSPGIASFVAGWFAPDGGFPLIRRVTLLPGGAIYARLHVADQFFVPFPESGPRLHFAFNFTRFLLGFDASVTELPFPLVGTEPGLDPSEPFAFLGTCDTGCSVAGTTDPVEFRLSQVPEPGSLALLGIALAAFAAARNKRGRHAQQA